jgi:hypothetical protein
MSSDVSQVIFNNSSNAISKMLLLPYNKTSIDEESLSTKFNPLLVEQKEYLFVRLLHKKPYILEFALPFPTDIFSDLSKEIIAITHLILNMISIV